MTKQCEAKDCPYPAAVPGADPWACMRHWVEFQAWRKEVLHGDDTP